MKEPRMIFGFALLVLLAALAGIIALGHVEEKTSFGLQYILGALSALTGGFAQWAFSSQNDKDKKENINHVNKASSSGSNDY